MSLVFAGVTSHGPGITARPETADPVVRDAFFAALGGMREQLEAARPDALVVIAAEHFANFFMNNMPAWMPAARRWARPISWVQMYEARP